MVEKISLLQLFILIFLFQIGSAVVVGIAGEAERDAWIAILIATVIGIIIIRLYTYILSYQPGTNLFDIMGQLFGRNASMIISLVYTTYFFYIAARVLRDFMELLITDLFPNTPIEVLSILFMIAVLYVIYLGPEVLGRTAETFFPYIIIFLLLTAIFLLASGDIKMHRLQPILAEGFTPIHDAIFPGLIGFPFGEAIVLTMFMALTNKFQHVTKVSIGAVIATGLTLSTIKIVSISVLGTELSERATFPLLTAAREIAFADFIERIDPIVIFVMMLGIFIKVSVFFFGGLKGLEYVFQVPYRYFSIPIGMIVALFTILIASNYTEHIEEGLQFVPLYLHMPLQIGIPTLLAMIIFIKGKQKKGGITNAE
ncbi:spore gernimation protein KC [Anaerobacillus arseniciselenatis]|uniref:Spore gernimation protein KC n=2 Tax=Anaerobacillus arseniciselenatis TaxID=85682 RepID=A0A1S2LAX0_9BACI|nr:spore gernimation protein KC [Anaerobacillus arseniciselenatis]